MKYVKAIKWLFLVSLFGVSMTSCAVLGSLLGSGNAQIFLTSPELGSTVRITSNYQVITLKGSITSDADIATVTINPNGLGVKPAEFFAGNWDVDLSVTPQDYTIEVTAKDVNGAESTETFSFTVVLDTNASGSSSSSSSSTSSAASSNSSSTMQFNVTDPSGVVYRSLNSPMSVVYDLNNSAYPVEISYAFTNIGKSWFATNVNIGGNASFDIPILNLAYLTEGVPTYVDVQAVDYANSVTVHDGFTLILDTTPPTVTLSNITEGQMNVVGTNVMLYIDANDSLSKVSWVSVHSSGMVFVAYFDSDVNGVVNTNMNIPIITGSNIIEVKASDNAYNVISITNVVIGTN